MGWRTNFTTVRAEEPRGSSQKKLSAYEALHPGSEGRDHSFWRLEKCYRTNQHISGKFRGDCLRPRKAWENRKRGRMKSNERGLGVTDLGEMTRGEQAKSLLEFL